MARSTASTMSLRILSSDRGTPSPNLVMFIFCSAMTLTCSSIDLAWDALVSIRRSNAARALFNSRCSCSVRAVSATTTTGAAVDGGGGGELQAGEVTPLEGDGGREAQFAVELQAQQRVGWQEVALQFASSPPPQWHTPPSQFLLWSQRAFSPTHRYSAVAILRLHFGCNIYGWNHSKAWKRF